MLDYLRLGRAPATIVSFRWPDENHFFYGRAEGIDKIIRHLKLTFQTERPPPPQVLQHELLMVAEDRGEYFSEPLWLLFIDSMVESYLKLNGLEVSVDLFFFSSR